MIQFTSKNAAFLCISHAGARGHEPENTLAGIQAALDLEAQWIEIDVHCAHGHILVLHDDVLTGPDGEKFNIRDKSYEYLRSLDVGKGQRIPTLQEVLALINGKACLNIELKGKLTAALVCTELKKHIETTRWSADDFLLSSFHGSELEVAKSLLPNIKRGFLFEDIKVPFLTIGEKIGAWSLNVSIDIVKKELIQAAHDKGFHVLVWTANTIDEIRAIKEMGADGIFTDYPERCRYL
jgi:glycerophosphoryl diester phosphodiesterase